MEKVYFIGNGVILPKHIIEYIRKENLKRKEEEEKIKELLKLPGVEVFEENLNFGLVENANFDRIKKKNKKLKYSKVSWFSKY